MARLRFSYGTMGSGKSTLALQIHHNLSSRGLNGLLCSQLARAAGKVGQLARGVDELGADVFAFGLLTSFQGELFEGTKRLLELSDESAEIQVEARCWCGERATHNARVVDGEQVYDGELFLVDDPDDHQIAYELRCRRHWLAGEEMTLADIAAAAHLSAVDYLGDVPWANYKSAAHWYARIKSRPSMRPILADAIPGLPAPKHYANLDF